MHLTCLLQLTLFWLDLGRIFLEHFTCIFPVYELRFNIGIHWHKSVVWMEIRVKIWSECLENKTNQIYQIEIIIYKLYSLYLFCSSGLWNENKKIVSLHCFVSKIFEFIESQKMLYAHWYFTAAFYSSKSSPKSSRFRRVAQARRHTQHFTDFLAFPSSRGGRCKFEPSRIFRPGQALDRL